MRCRTRSTSRRASPRATPSAAARSACGSRRSWSSTPRRARTCSTRCCSRTRAARPTRPRWRRCSTPTTTSPSARRSGSTGPGGCPRSSGRCARSRPRAGSRARVDRLRAIKTEGKVTRALMEARCERGAEIALMLGFDRETAEGIRTLDEHWDGGGQPRGLRGEEIPLLGRILCLAQTAEIFHAAGGRQAAHDVARHRSGGWFDPALVDAFAGRRRRRRVLGGAARRRPRHLGARRAPHRRRRGPARPDRRRVRRDHRREVAVDLPALRPRVPDRHGRRRRARRGGPAAARPAPRRAPARHRQARGLQPDPRQARRGSRARSTPGSASTR